MAGFGKRIAPVAGLTVVASLLRLASADESLFGDDLFLFEIVDGQGAGEVVSDVRATESTPPLHFLMAWLATRVGDPTTSVRLPSLLFGSATVPLVYVLGLRTVGRAGALIGAALYALSPFAIFYATDARAYATLAFLAALSTLALLVALDTGRARWWAAFAASSCAVLWTHYAGVFVVAAQAGWAAWAHRDRLRPLALSCAAAAAGWLPWLPSLLVQRGAQQRIEELYALTVESLLRGIVKVLPGHPFLPLRELPGRAALVLLALALAAGLAHAARGRRAGRLSPRHVLVVVLALATPLGLVLYSLGPTSVFLPRNLIASLPAACLALGALLAGLDRPLRPAAVAAAMAALAVGSLKTLDPDFGRPPFREAAELIEARAGPNDAVVQVAAGVDAPSRALDAYLEPPLEPYRAGEHDGAAYERARDGGRVFLVVPRVGLLARTSGARGLPRDFRLVDRREYRGLVPIAVFTYRSAGGG